MPISASHAYSRGMISSKALSRMKGSASMGPKGKMTNFDNKDKTDEGKGPVGVLKKNEINNSAQQKTARVAGQTIGKPSSAGGGYKTAKGGLPGAGAINQGNARKFPAGATVKRSNGKVKNRGNSGGSDTNGGAHGMKSYYGGPSNNRNG